MAGNILNNLGFALGKHPMAAGIQNEKGYFENIRLMEFHELVLEEAGSSWSDPHPIPSTWWTDTRLQRLSGEISALIQSEFPGNPRILIKDPRMCRLLPLWKAYLAGSGVKCRWLLPLRHPFSVAKSLGNRDGFSSNYALLLWAQHVLEAERGTRGSDRIILQHEALLDGTYVAPLANLLSLSPEAVRKAAEGVVDAALVHHQGAKSDFEENSIHLFVKRVWEALGDLSRRGDGDCAQLDALWKEYIQIQAVIPEEFSGQLNCNSDQLERKTWLHCDIGRGFSKRACCVAQYSTKFGVRTARFEIPAEWAGKARTMRWAPTKGSFVAIRDLKATDNHGRSYELSPLELVGTRKGWAIFSTMDPRVNITPPPAADVTSITIRCRLRPIKLSEVTDLKPCSKGAGNSAGAMLDGPEVTPTGSQATSEATHAVSQDKDPKSKAVEKKIKWSLKSRLSAWLPFIFLIRRKTRRAVRELRHSGGFDRKFYQAQLPEGFAIHKPIIHYCVIGWKLGLKPHASSDSGLPGIPTLRRIVLFSGEPGTSGHTYRVAMLGDAMAVRGWDAQVLGPEDIRSTVPSMHGVTVLYLWRAAWDRGLDAMVTAARWASAKVVFDVDDLMFEPALAKTTIIDGIRTQGLAEQDVADYYKRVRRTLRLADFCTCPTEPLATALRRHGRPVLVIPNGFDAGSLSTSSKAAAARLAQPDDGRIRLGYASGSRTHQRDFARAVGAIARILREHPECLLVLFRLPATAGHTPYLLPDEFPELAGLAHQIEWRDIVPLGMLSFELARFDVNLAPLETGNPFCEAKSELKYFEAALVNVPTVASPTTPFASAIRDGVTGFLAADESGWYAALKRLVTDPILRASIAQNAHWDVLWRYGPERRAELADLLLEQILGKPRNAARLFELEVRRKSAARRPFPDIPAFDLVMEKGVRGQCEAAVIVPLYNYAHYVEEALDSVRAQTLKGIELIVVDDCSTDDSLAVVKRWIEQKGSELAYVALYRNQQNSGLAASRNVGFAATHAAYIMPLDADNILQPQCIMRCLEEIKRSGATFVYPTIRKFGDEEGVIGASFWHPARFVGGNYIDAMALLRRSAWAAVGGYRRMKVMGWEDFELWCRFVEEGFWGIWVQEDLALYRVHGSSMIQTARNLGEIRSKLVEEIHELHPWLDATAVAGTWGDFSEDDDDDLEDTVPAKPKKPRPHTQQRLAELIGILRCPVSKQSLRMESADSLITEDGSHRWPLVAWRPVFFGTLADARIFPDSHMSNPVPAVAREIIENSSGLVLNLSAGGSQAWHPNLVELETAVFRNTDVVGDSHSLPFADGVFEAVLAINAFEHYREPLKVVSEILRVLKPGGRVFIHTAFMQPLHEPPWHFYNCTRYGLEQWFAGFASLDITVSPNFNPIYSLAWQCSEFLRIIGDELGEASANRTRTLTVDQLSSFWRDEKIRSDNTWDDFLSLPQPAQERLAAGFQLLAQKPTLG